MIYKRKSMLINKQIKIIKIYKLSKKNSDLDLDQQIGIKIYMEIIVRINDKNSILFNIKSNNYI